VRPTFRLDICDPLTPQTGKDPLAFSFEEEYIDDNDPVDTQWLASLAFAEGFGPWIHKGLIMEDGLRVLARAALATADQLQATKALRKEKK
jgi:hypothetical protein